jgi:hypothetical protein
MTAVKNKFAAAVAGSGAAFVDHPYWKTSIPSGRRTSSRRWSTRASGRTSAGRVATSSSREMLNDFIHPEGGLEAMTEWPEKKTDKPLIREMIDTSQGQMALLEKVRIDVAFGMADIPLLYGPLYERIAPAGGFPGGVYQLTSTP